MSAKEKKEKEAAKEEIKKDLKTLHPESRKAHQILRKQLKDMKKENRKRKRIKSEQPESTFFGNFLFFFVEVKILKSMKTTNFTFSAEDVVRKSTCVI